MPKFSKTSLDRLATCHPELQILFNEVIKFYDCTVLEGHRGKEAQEAAFKAGNTKLHYPYGNHNKSPSMAVDVAPYPVNFDNNVKNLARFYHFAGYVLATAQRLFKDGKMNHKLRWGGDWDSDLQFNDQSFNDLPHYELLI